MPSSQRLESQREIPGHFKRSLDGLVRTLNRSWNKALPQAIHRTAQNSLGHLLGQACQGRGLTQAEVNPRSGPR